MRLWAHFLCRQFIDELMGVRQKQELNTDRDADKQEPPQAKNEDQFIPLPLQDAILKALDGQALKKQALADKVCKGEGTVLYRSGGLKELRDRGLVYQRLECFRPALSDLQNYLRRRPQAPDATEVHGKIVELQQAAARLN